MPTNHLLGHDDRRHVRVRGPPAAVRQAPAHLLQQGLCDAPDGARVAHPVLEVLFLPRQVHVACQVSNRQGTVMTACHALRITDTARRATERQSCGRK